MENIELLSKQQLLELVGQQQKELVTSQKELVTSQKELARERDITRQLEEKNRQLEKDYLQLFRDRFGRKSERYIADANQLRIDFGDTDDAADAADGLADA
ncbi:MAG: hypothetical protein GY924_26695, partial [Planctomycetaceae bacterium]|nr:hypothetical protein [Planctomycetaceae bacterium]